MLRKAYLSKEALVNLKNYKYVSGEYSVLDNALTPFWNKVVTFMPLWLAPNLITLIGLLNLASNLLLCLPRDLSMTKPLPPEFSIFFALTLFVYQTLDAIDGKQARRTGSSSPLGQLFDHGCDAWSTVIAIWAPL
jgi:ethanolaminephosphotransferase